MRASSSDERLLGGATTGFLVNVFSLMTHGSRRGRLEKVLRSAGASRESILRAAQGGNARGLDCARNGHCATGNSVVSPRFHRVTHHQVPRHAADHRQSLATWATGASIACRAKSSMTRWIRNWSSCLAGHQIRISKRSRLPLPISAPISSPPRSRDRWKNTAPMSWSATMDYTSI